MTARKQRPGCDPGALEDTRLGGGESFAMVTRGDDDEPVAAKLRRRRSAGWRLPPLEDGHRDPLDALAGLPARRVHRCAGVEFTATGVRPCCRVAA